MRTFWKYLIVVAAAGSMTVGCDRDHEVEYEASGPGYEAEYEVEREPGALESEIQMDGELDIQAQERERGVQEELEFEGVEIEGDPEAERGTVDEQMFEGRTEDERIGTEFDETPGAMADRGTDEGQAERAQLDRQADQRQRQADQRQRQADQRQRQADQRQRQADQRQRQADQRQADREVTELQETEDSDEPRIGDVTIDTEPQELESERERELAQIEEDRDRATRTGEMETGETDTWDEPAETDEWAETDQPREIDPMTETDRSATTGIDDEGEVAVGEPEPAPEAGIEEEPVRTQDQDQLVFDETQDDLDLMTAEEDRMGIGFMVGGGVNDYVNDFDEPTDTGGNWDVRAVFGTQSILAGELAYHGTANGIDVLGVDDGAVLMSNGAEGAVRLNFLTDSFQPYILGGIGWKHFSIENTDTNTSNVADNDNAMTVPLGAGLSYKFGDAFADVRGMYRPAFLADVVDDGIDEDTNLDTISGSLNLGFHF